VWPRGGNGTARSGVVSAGRQQLSLPHGRTLMCAAFSPDGGRVITADGQPILRAALPLEAGGRLRGSQSAMLLRTDGEARVWDAATGRQLTPPLKHAGGVRLAAFSPAAPPIVTATPHG